MSFKYIVNPETGRKVKSNGKIGTLILKKYLKQLGGAKKDDVETRVGMTYNQLISSLKRPDTGTGKTKKMPRFYVSDVYTCLEPLKIIACHLRDTFIFEEEHLLDKDKPSIIWDDDDHPANNKSLAKIWGLYGHRTTKEPREAIENFVDSLGL